MPSASGPTQIAPVEPPMPRVALEISTATLPPASAPARLCDGRARPLPSVPNSQAPTTTPTASAIA